MNDDDISPKIQPTPAPSEPDAAPNDTEEQDTVSDRVFDFSDGDIKPVKDVDGPVTHSVNLEIAEALRNPKATIIRKEMPRPPINKLEAIEKSTPQNTLTPPVQKQPLAPTLTPKPIPHPPIDPQMQAPAIKVYSQIPHPPAQQAPTIAKSAPTKTPISTEKTAIQQPVVAPVAVPIIKKDPETPASAAALQEILKKVHSQTQATPPVMQENLLDKNIGSMDSSPFAGQKPRNIPANPPAKTISGRLDSYSPTPSVQPGPQNLQDAVSSVLPGENTPPGIPGVSNQFSELLKPLRTYEGDVAEVMSHKRTSTASIAIAETKKSGGEERISSAEPKPSSHVLLKMLMTLLILVLLGGGAWGAYYLYSKSPLATSISTTPVQQQQGRPGIVRADSYAVIAIDNQLPAIVLSRIQGEAAKSQSPGSIKELILARKNTNTSTNTFTQISASDALGTMDISAPDMLTRTFTPDWMLGVYSSPENTKGAFVIVTTNFFQNAFAGMLQWESVMADDLKQYLYSSQVSGISNTITNNYVPPVPANLFATTSVASTTASTATSTATTTPPESVDPLKLYFTLRGKFEDRIVKNKDVRAFRTENGSILFLYSFIDNTHLAIASDEATLAEILTRLEKQALIR